MENKATWKIQQGCSHVTTGERDRVIANGEKRIELFCIECGYGIRFVSHKTIDDFILWFGKHKGLKAVDVIKFDRPYIEWMLSKPNLIGGWKRQALTEYLKTNAK